MPVVGVDWAVTLVDATGTAVTGLAADTELPAAAALVATGVALPTTPTVGAALYGYNGATLDLLKADTTNGLLVNTEMPAAALDGDTFDIAATAIPKVGAIMHAMSSGGTLAGRLIGHTSASDGRANTLNGLLVQSVPYTRNASNTNDPQRGINAATATTGTGVPSSGPALWDLVGVTNYVRQAGDGSGRAMVVGAAAAGAAVTSNPVLVGISDGTNARRLLGNTDGSLAVGGFAPAAPTCTFTRPANTTAYTIGDEVGTASTAPTTIAVGRVNGGTGIIQGAQVIYSGYAAVIPQLVLLVFNATVTLAGDNAQLNLSDADAAKLVCTIPLTYSQTGQYSAGAAVSAGNTIFAGTPSRPSPHFVLGGSEQTLYCCLITLNAFTPIANSETLVVVLDVELN